MITEQQVEEILRRKYYNENLIKYHNETSVTPVLSFSPPSHSGTSKVEKKAMALAEAKYEMLIVKLVLGICTQREKDFVALRYFEGKSMKDIVPLMLESKKTLERLRKKILSATLSIMNLDIDA